MSIDSTDVISIVALVISIVALYYNFLQIGTLRFLRPAFIGFTRYGEANDMIIVSMIASNTGVGPKAARLKLVLDGRVVVHHQLDLDRVPIPEPNEKFDLAGHLSAPTPVSVNPKSTAVKVAGFAQGFDKIRTSPLPRLDLWYDEGSGWKYAWTIVWTSFAKLMEGYQSGMRGSTAEFRFQTGSHKPTYGDPDILEK